MKLVMKQRGGKPYFYTISEYGEWQAKHAKFRWDRKEKTWWTDDLKKAYRLRDYAAPKLQKKLDEMVQAEQAKAEASLIESRATDADIDIPVPKGLNYLPYQKAGIQYALQREATLIGDEMGLGKTVQSIGAINALDEAQSELSRVLVICPASLRLNWKHELEKWLVHNGYRGRNVPFKRVGVAIGKQWPDTPIVVINYDILSRHEAKIKGTAWDLMVVDECHYLKNPKTARTKQVFGGKGIKPIQAKKRLFLTGTPMVNRPIELFPILKSINKSEWGNWINFVTQYCDGHQTSFGWDVSGASNLDELQDRMRSTCMVRRLKRDVLKDLPAKRRQVIELPMNGAAAVVKREQRLRAKQDKELARLKLAVELSKASEDKATYDAAVAALKEAQAIAFTEMAAARKETAIAKIPAMINRIEDVLETGNKVVIFTHHHEVTDALMEALPPEQVVKLDGRSTMPNRDKAVRRFQEDENVKVFIGGLKAAGVGLTLTAASHVIFGELDWVPGVLSQAEDRCHRIGQNESVLVQHLVLEGSIDAIMAHTLVAKQRVLDEALDIHTDPDRRKRRQAEEMAPVQIPEEDQRELEFLNWQERAQIALADQQQAERIANADQANRYMNKKRSATYDEITKEAEGLTREEINFWHEGVQRIQALCDGAKELDGVGFSMMDLEIGHSLAKQFNLSPRQGAMAKRLCRKYRRQLGDYEFSPKTNEKVHGL